MMKLRLKGSLRVLDKTSTNYEKKIVFLCRALSIGGTERQLLLLASHLKRQGYQVTIVTFYKSESSYPFKDIKHINLEKKSRWHIFSFIKTLINTLKNENADYIYSFLDVANILSCLLKGLGILKKEIVLIGFRGANIKWKDYDYISWIAARIEAYSSKFADAVITNSQAGIEELRKRNFKAAHTFQVANGIDTSLFVPDFAGGREWRKKYNLPLNVPIVGLVARLDPIKAHQTFLRAAFLLQEKMENIHFAIIGEGASSYQETLIAFQKQLGIRDDRLSWIKCGNDINYNALDVVCLTSYSEGFPNVLAEALSTGVPCISTDVGEARNILKDDNRIIAVGDYHALAKKILEIMNIKSEKDICALREKITKYYSTDHMVENTIKIMNYLIKDNKLNEQC